MVRPVFVRSITFSAKSLKSSSLLPSTLKKLFQSEGILADARTFLRLPYSLFSLVQLFRVFMVHVPYNIHSLYCFQLSCDVRGKNIIKVISKGLSCAWFQHLNYESPIKNGSIDSWLCGALARTIWQAFDKICFLPSSELPVSDSEGGQG